MAFPQSFITHKFKVRPGAIIAASVLAVLLAAPSSAQSAYFKNSTVPRLPERVAPETPEHQKLLQDNRAERQREIEALHLTGVRDGTDGRNPDAPNAANYDPALANPYPRPSDVLRMEGGAETTTAALWWAERRPEIVAAFEREIYGRMPDNVPGVTWKVVSTKTESVNGVKAVVKELVGHVDNSAYPSISVEINMTETLPANVKGRVPVILQYGGGNRIPQGKRPSELLDGYKTPGPYTGPDGRTQLLKLGWGFATIDANSVQADNAAGLSAGIIGLVNKGQPRKMDDWGVLRAWGWGASRALDYLQSDPRVAADEIGITGHSRAGKAAIVAMAFDSRFAIGFISSSGGAGAKLLRHNYGETLESIAAPEEFHWMAGNYLKYVADPLNANYLPVDADAMISLCAPRPVFISAGNPESGDAWVDAPGTFMAALGAGPVYTLLGKKPLESDTFPALGTPLLGGDIGFRQHNYGHGAAQGPNWETFLKFAQKYFKIEKR